MDAQSYQKVEEIYYSVLDQTPENKLEFISKAALGDEDIIEKVLKLLSIDDYQTYNKTSENALINLTEIIEERSESFNSDKYKIVKKIGEGGMGSVYLANRIDQEVDQQVAIKLINSTFTTDANIDRFKKERQILASIDHENIARFIDAGTTKSGIIFVVMEYIDGDSLTHYCEKYKLTLNQRLALFLQLCDAINYAHKNFIIHRDIKPTNILVNSEGKIKLLDFGIAKLVDEDSQKMVATVTRVMTPAYASPEQLLGKNITQQSDVYTLGVVLFELLIGERPFKKFEKDTHAFQVNVINGITSKPSQLLTNTYQEKSHINAIDNDIDAILTKLINPNLKQRYASVNDVIEDISNYLNDYPVKARTPNTWYFTKLFILRNKLLVSLSAAIFSIVLAFGIYSFLQNEQLKARGVELSKQRDEAIFQAKRAKLASDFLLESFQTADPTRTFGEKLTIKQVMEDSFEKLKQDPLDDKKLNAEMFHTISKAFYGMNLVDIAHESANFGLKWIEKINSEPLLKVKLLIDRANTYFTKRNYLSSIIDLNQALLICKKSEWVKDCLIDEIYFHLAKNQFNLGKRISASELMKKSLRWIENRKINDLRYVTKLVFFAKMKNSFKKPNEAINIIEKIYAITSKNSKKDGYYILEADLQFIAALRILNKFKEAVMKLNDVQKIIEEKYGTENILYIRAINFRAILNIELKKYKEAKINFEKIINIKKKLHLDYSTEVNKIGNLYYYREKNYKKAISYYVKAIELDNKINPTQTSTSGFFRRNLGFAYYKISEYKKALTNLRKSKVIFMNYESDYPDVIKMLDNWIDYLENL